jgi:hypothetical protein
MTDFMAQAVVDTKSAWYSKVNWLAALTALATTLNELLPMVPAQYQHAVTVAIVVVGGLSTIIAKTFYTTTVTPSSASKAPLVQEEAVTSALNVGQTKKS